MHLRVAQLRGYWLGMFGGKNLSRLQGLDDLPAVASWMLDCPDDHGARRLGRVYSFIYLDPQISTSRPFRIFSREQCCISRISTCVFMKE